MFGMGGGHIFKVNKIIDNYEVEIKDSFGSKACFYVNSPGTNISIPKAGIEILGLQYDI